MAICFELAYVLFSTSVIRRSPLFIVNQVSFVLCAIYAVFAQRRAIVEIHQHFDHTKSADLAYVVNILLTDFFSILAPVVADSTLLFKLNTFYPSWHAPVLKRLAILGVIATLLAGRLFCSFMMLFLDYFDVVAPVAKGHDEKGKVIFRHTAAIRFADSLMQLATSTFGCCLLLYRAYHYRRQMQASSTVVQRRLRFFVESTTMTFLPPVCIQIVLVVGMFINNIPGRTAYGWGIALNVLFSYAFSILATSWSTIREAPFKASSNRPHDHSTASSVSEVVPNQGHPHPHHHQTQQQHSQNDRTKISPINQTIIGSIMSAVAAPAQEAYDDHDQMEVLVSLPHVGSTDIGALENQTHKHPSSS